jgi:hypothetical protein
MKSCAITTSAAPRVTRATVGTVATTSAAMMACRPEPITAASASPSRMAGIDRSTSLMRISTPSSRR